jgi:hypothetical protein
MRSQRIFILSLLCFIYLVAIPFLYSQENQVDIEQLKKKAPKVFLDCPSCDSNYIRTEITFVNYVRDRKEADVHILVTTQTTGSGGREYTCAFIGQKDYEDIQATLKYVSRQTDTSDEIRQGMVKVLKKGLVPYVAKTPLADYVSVLFEEKVKPTSVEDKWNFWVFSMSFSSFLDGEKAMNYNSISGNFSANRVTPDTKLRMSISAYRYENNYDIDGETISSTADSKSFSFLFVKSISEHWSVGAWLSASSSTYKNTKLVLSPAPAVEYNLFRYSESTRRQLRFLYKVGYSINRYREETIYDKISESLLNESLSVTLELQEPWGNASVTLEGSHYFHDFDKNRLELDVDFDIRLFKGLSLNIWAYYAGVHDQLSLVKGEATLEEILLQRTELATNYSYYASIGFSYTFGSVFSNVVNPRFGR